MAGTWWPFCLCMGLPVPDGTVGEKHSAPLLGATNLTPDQTRPEQTQPLASCVSLPGLGCCPWPGWPFIVRCQLGRHPRVPQSVAGKTDFSYNIARASPVLGMLGFNHPSPCSGFRGPVMLARRRVDACPPGRTSETFGVRLLIR
jgi:hypothetical protein